MNKIDKMARCCSAANHLWWTKPQAGMQI